MQSSLILNTDIDWGWNYSRGVAQIIKSFRPIHMKPMTEEMQVVFHVRDVIITIKFLSKQYIIVLLLVLKHFDVFLFKTDPQINVINLN